VRLVKTWKDRQDKHGVIIFFDPGHTMFGLKEDLFENDVFTEGLAKNVDVARQLESCKR
jgi:hypothetical protein